MMWALENLPFRWSDPWVAPAIGLAAAGLVFLLGRLIVGLRRSAAGRPSGRPTQTEAAHDPFTQTSARERRIALRRGGNPVAVFISDAEGRAKPTNGWVIDRSTGGLCLSVDEPVVEGTVISVRTSNAPQTVPWVQLEVKNCRAIGREYELGCQFVRTPPWSVLLLFG